MSRRRTHDEFDINDPRNWDDTGDERPVPDKIAFQDHKAAGHRPEDLIDKPFARRYAAWLKKSEEPAKAPTPLSPGKRAQLTAKWARTMTKWLITRSRKNGAKWRLVDFGGPTGAESYGIVDLVAVRKDHRLGENSRRGDRLEIVLIQVKGGGAAMPTAKDVERLRSVMAHHRASAVVLSEWKRGKKLAMYKLAGREWRAIAPSEVFGATLPAKRAR